MKSARWSVVGLCVGALVLGALASPTTANATVPSTTPTIDSPDGSSPITSNPLSVSATSSDSDPQAFVRFVLDGGHGGSYVADANINGGGKANTSLPVVGLDGSVNLVAYDCDGSVTPADCNTGFPATVALNINLPAPVITSPAPQSVHQDQVTVNVDDNNGGGITFTLDNGTPIFDTSGPPYAHTFNLVGEAQGQHTVKVTQCNNDGTVCQGPTDSVTFVHDTTPTTTPTITSPNGGTPITTGPMTVTATSNNTDAQAFVRFVLDGGHGGAYVVDADVTVGGTASAPMPVAGLNGATKLVAYDCDGQVSPPVCNTGSPDSVNLTINLPAPVIQVPTSDGQHFQSTVLVTAATDSGGLLFDLPGVGSQFVGPPATSPYSHSFDISSFTDGQTGTVTVTQCNDDGSVCQGKSAQVSFVRDLNGPSWTAGKAAPQTFYPAHDPGRQFRNQSTLSTHVAEPVTNVVLRIVNARGKIVRKVNLPDQGAGRVAWTWNGRNNRKDRVAAGTYSFRFSGLDSTLNGSQSDPGVVFVSNKVLRVVHKRIVKKALRTQPLAARSQCSAPFPLVRGTPAPHFRGGIGYYSNYRCNHGIRQSIASATHQIPIIDALRYRTIRVDVYGAAAAKHGGAGHLLYWRPGKGKQLSPTHRTALAQPRAWHRGRPAKLAPLVKDHTFKWAVYTYKGAWYNVGKFRITYSALALVRPKR